MLQLSVIRENKDLVIERLAVKNFAAKEIVEKLLIVDEDRRKTQNELDTLLNQSNTISKQIGDLMKTGKKAEAEDLRNKSTALKETAKQLNERLSGYEKEVHDLLVKLPNMPSTMVPKGKTPADNEVVHQEG